jgi:AraC-like DNA-binding protein
MESHSAAPDILLGQVVGTYRERPTTPILRPHFAGTWFNRIHPGLPRLAAIVPDGHIDLEWIDGRLRVAGPDRVAKIEPLEEGATVIGLRFHPGAAAAWLRTPASALVNGRVPLEAFWGSEATTLADRVSQGDTPDDVARQLETALAARASKVGAPNPVAPEMLKQVRANRQPDVIPRLRDRLELSERTIRRLSHEAFGYGPKMLERILRFQRFLRLARTAAPGGLASLAFEAGYADQAHLTRETGELAGMTPRAILAQLAG